MCPESSLATYANCSSGIICRAKVVCLRNLLGGGKATILTYEGAMNVELAPGVLI